MNGGVTIREMESIARSMDGEIGLSSELGNVIDITDSSDALGLNMLMNQAKVSTNQSGNNNGGNTISVSAPPAYSSSMGGIEISTLEPLEPVTLNMDSGYGAPPVEITFQKEQSSPSLFQNQQTASGPSVAFSPVQQQRDPEREKKEKIDYLNKLQRLEQKGFPVGRRYTMDNSLDEIKGEYDRLVDARNLEGSLRFQRQALMGVVTGLEWMNNRFDPFDLNLEGWSESVHENVEDFDEIFEELYDKYKDRGKMPPEARLLFSLAGSGFMVHVSNTFMKQRMPSAADVLKNNPELARQFAAAAATQAGSGFGNFMGMAMGAAGGGPQPQMQMPAGPQGISPEATTGAFFGASQRPDFTNQMPNAPQVIASVEPMKQTARREMKGPSGVDDILKTFEEVRRQEVMGGMDGGMAGVGMMDPPRMNNMVSPPAMNQPAVAAVMEMESIASGDIGSMAESTRTGGGRRRRKAAISGNTLAVNV